MGILKAITNIVQAIVWGAYENEMHFFFFVKMFDFKTQVCIEKAKSTEDGHRNNCHSLGILVFTQA